MGYAYHAKGRYLLLHVRHNAEEVSKVLGDRPITSDLSQEINQFRDPCFEQNTNKNTVKRVAVSVKDVLSFSMRKRGLESDLL